MAEEMVQVSAPQRSIRDVLEDVFRNLEHMLRSELRLVVAEFREEGKKVTRGLAVAAIGGLLLASTLALLLTSLVLALSRVMTAWAAALSVAVGCAVIGAIALRGGLKQLS